MPERTRDTRRRTLLLTDARAPSGPHVRLRRLVRRLVIARVRRLVIATLRAHVVIAHLVHHVRALLLVRLRDLALAEGLAHVREEALLLLVLLLLPRLRLLQQLPGLPVLRVELDDLLAPSDAVAEILQAVLSLRLAEGCFHVQAVLFEHLLARLFGLGVELQLQGHSSLVQLARLLEVLGLRLVLLLEVVDVAEHLAYLLVARERHLQATGLEELGSLLLPGSAELELLLLGQAPAVLGLLKVLQLHGQHHLVRRHALQAQLLLLRQRGR
mmetsp:Transcript_122767/g.347927  ORF Transcript_122767/g.347927 Transcript_122767/m.347927 type:complete len:271 (-) Transcript_122767:1091-1903(-)